MMKTLFLSAIVLISASAAHAQRGAYGPRQICESAAFSYQAAGGGYVDVYNWCSDVGTIEEAYCREAALFYKLDYDPNMQVKTWCQTPMTMDQVSCIRQTLPRKGRTGYPTNVKDYCGIR